MESVILTIHLLIAATLIVVVLLQRSEGGGLGIGGGGVMSGRSAATALSKLTWVLGIAFVATSLTLTVIAARQDGAGSVLDRLGVDAPATETAPGLDGGDLLPPPGTLAPAVPPSDAIAPAVPPAGDGPAAPPPVE